MTTTNKLIKVAAVAAVATSSLAGVGGITAEASSSLTLGLNQDKNAVQLSFTNTTDVDATITRNNDPSFKVPKVKDQTDYVYEDLLTKTGHQLGNLSTILSVEDKVVSPAPEGTESKPEEPKVVVTVPTKGLNVSENIKYSIKYGESQGPSDTITVTHNPQVAYFLVTDKDTASKSELKTSETPGLTLELDAKDVVGKYLYTYVKDEVTGAESSVTKYKLSDHYTGSKLPQLSNAVPTVTVDNTKIASSVNVTLELPAGLEDTSAKIMYSVGYGKYQEYTAPINVKENTVVQTYITDGLGSQGIVKEITINNIVHNFGKEYKVVTNGNKFTVEVPKDADYLSHIEFSVNGSRWTQYNSAVTAEVGVHKIETRAVSKDGTVSDIVTTEWIVGGNSTAEEEADKAKKEYAEKLKNATDLTVVAETTKLQSDIDKARESYKDLAVADKLLLEERLNKVQEYVYSIAASAAITKVQGVPTLDNLIEAYLAIGKVKTASTVSTLEKQLEPHALKALDATTAAKINTAVEELVESVRLTPTEEGLYAINKLIGEVSDSTLKESLMEDIKEIEVLVKSKDALANAESLVVRAEKNQTTKSYNDAKAAVDKLPDSAIKTKLLKRLAVVEKVLSVMDNELIDKIQSGKEVTAEEIATYSGRDIPKSLTGVITDAISNLKDNATEANIVAVIDLHVAYDKAIRGMTSKDINAYAKLYNAHKGDLPTIGKMPSVDNLTNAFKFLTDEKVLNDLIKGLESETGKDLRAYFNTLAPSIVKVEGSNSTIIDYGKQKELEANRTYQVVKATLLTKEALIQNKEEARTLAKAYVTTLKNGGFKQSLLSSLGVTGADLEKAGENDDEIVKPGDKPTDGKDEDKEEDKGEGETLPKAEPQGELAGLSEFYIYPELADTDFAKDIKAADPTMSESSGNHDELKAGEVVYLTTTNGIELSFELPVDAKWISHITTQNPDGSFTMKVYLDGKLTDISDASLKFKREKSGTLTILNGTVHEFQPIHDAYDGVTYNAKVSTQGGLTIGFVNKAIEYTDVNETVPNVWGKMYIDELTSRGVVTNTTNIFNPKSEITRAEFATWIARMLGVTPDTATDSFDDLNYNDPDYGYIVALQKIGVIKGNESGEFMPDKSINRQQAALIIARALNYKGVDVIGGAPTFKDNASISVEALAVVGALQRYAIFEGSDGKFKPGDKLTRQQAAKVITLSATEAKVFK